VAAVTGFVPLNTRERTMNTTGRAGGAVLAGAALGFLAGVALNPARKALLQGTEALAGDWYDVLKAEHRIVEAAMDLVLKTRPSQTGRRQVLLLQIAHALNKHAVQEENVIYPALRKVDEAAARHFVDDHADIKSLLNQLQYGCDKSDPRWIEAMHKLRDTVVEHAREEEDEIFPKLRALGADENASLTRQLHWEGLKVA
jgi:hemerythrin superfamily protein